MKKDCMIALCALALSIILWVILIAVDILGMDFRIEVIVFAGGILSTITCIGFGMICIVNRIAGTISPYLIFGAADVIIGILVTIFSLYDINNIKSSTGGWLGFGLLFFVVPCPLILLVIDIVIWIKKCRK